MARVLPMLAALALAGMAAHCEGSTLVVNSAIDTSTAASTCGASCNFRTAWGLAASGDTILVSVNPIMESPISSCPNIKGNITVLGKTGGQNGGAAYASGKGTTKFFIQCNLPGKVDLVFDNMVIEKFNGTTTIEFWGTDIASEHNKAHVTAHKKRQAGPKAVGQPATTGSTITFYKCSFLTNAVAEKGALSFWELNEVNVVDCKFMDNESAGNFGGALFGWACNKFNVYGSQFIRNFGAHSVLGGDPKKLHVKDCTFQMNKAEAVITAENGLAIAQSNFEANNADILIYVDGPNGVNASNIVGEMRSDDATVIYSYDSPPSTTILALSDSTFWNLDGSDVNMANFAAKIFNQNPGNTKMATGPGVFQSCQYVFKGPLPCFKDAWCEGVNNGMGEEVGYECKVE